MATAKLPNFYHNYKAHSQGGNAVPRNAARVGKLNRPMNKLKYDATRAKVETIKHGKEVKF